MTTPSRREALLARFRQGSLTRVDAMLARLTGPAEGLGDELHAPLHTLKGEARMLGLASLASYAHAIEDAVAQLDHGDPRVAAALGLVRDWLQAPLVEDDAAADRLAYGQALLRGEIERDELDRDGLDKAAGAPPPPASPAPAELRLSLVPTASVDALCERLEQLRVEFVRRRGGGDLDALQRELAELTELAWSLRLVPVEPALAALSEHARALATELGKQLRVVVDAGGAQLERERLELLQEPLLHLVTNAVDHGIEPGSERGDKPAIASLWIAARTLGPELELELRDDGRGVALERVRAKAVARGLLGAAEARAAGDAALLALLFESGFSTSEAVDELSGRGVGLHAVRRAVEGLGGSVAIESQAGHGTRFVLRVPASISREPVLVIELGDARWGLPSRRVATLVAIASAGAATIVIDGEHVPLVSLARLLGVPEQQRPRVAAVCEHGGRRYALACPGPIDEHELFRRPLGPTLARACVASSSAILDDGRLVLLVEPAALLDRGLRGLGAGAAPDQVLGDRSAPVSSAATVLVVDDSAIVRELLGELLRGAGLRVATASDGLEALAVLRRGGVDLVLSDVEMPDMTGFTLLSRVRERDRDLPFVMLTTRSSPNDRRRAAELGASAYLVKSEFREQSLLDTIARFVEVPR